MYYADFNRLKTDLVLMDQFKQVISSMMLCLKYRDNYINTMIINCQLHK